MSLSLPSSVSQPPASTTEVAFVVPGEPRGKGRPRASHYGGFFRLHTDAKTLAYERMVAAYAKVAMATAPPLQGPLAVYMLFRYSVPKSFTKTRRRAVLAGLDAYLGRFDVDNLAKSVGDALHGIVYEDDAQIVRLTVLKRPDANPGVDIMVKPYDTRRVP